MFSILETPLNRTFQEFTAIPFTKESLRIPSFKGVNNTLCMFFLTGFPIAVNYIVERFVDSFFKFNGSWTIEPWPMLPSSTWIIKTVTECSIWEAGWSGPGPSSPGDRGSLAREKPSQPKGADQADWPHNLSRRMWVMTLLSQLPAEITQSVSDFTVWLGCLFSWPNESFTTSWWPLTLIWVMDVNLNLKFHPKYKP